MKPIIKILIRRDHIEYQSTGVRHMGSTCIGECLMSVKFAAYGQFQTDAMFKDFYESINRYWRTREPLTNGMHGFFHYENPKSFLHIKRLF